MRLRTGFIYRGQVWSSVGTWAWLLHRITGICLLFYVLQYHVILVSALLSEGEDAFNAILAILMFHPVFKALNTLLLAALYYHFLNGTRLLLHDMGIGVNVNTTRRAFVICLFGSVGLWISTVSFVL